MVNFSFRIHKFAAAAIVGQENSILKLVKEVRGAANELYFQMNRR